MEVVWNIPSLYKEGFHKEGRRIRHILCTMSCPLVFTYAQGIWPLVLTSVAAVATSSVGNLTNLTWVQPNSILPHTRIMED